MLNYKEYILSEAIKPVKTDYGWFDKQLNFVEGKIEETAYSIRTAFKHEDNYYTVYFNLYHENPIRAELNFSRIDNMKNINLMFGATTMKPLNDSKVSIQIFNKVFYIALMLAKEYGIDTFEYSDSADNKGLSKLYNSFYNNKNFKEELNKQGYSITKEDYKYIVKEN